MEQKREIVWNCEKLREVVQTLKTFSVNSWSDVHSERVTKAKIEIQKFWNKNGKQVQGIWQNSL